MKCHIRPSEAYNSKPEGSEIRKAQGAPPLFLMTCHTDKRYVAGKVFLFHFAARYNGPEMRIRSSLDDGLTGQQWDDYSQRHDAGHLLQSWTWGELKARFGWFPLRLAVLEGEQIVAATQILFRRLPLGRWTTAYVPRGPMLNPASLREPASAALMLAVHATCRQQHALSLKVEPGWPEEGPTLEWFRSQGLRPSEQTVQPRRTVVVDLRPDENDILAQMKPKTRYNIRLAQRKGVVVRQGTADDLPLFHDLLRVTGERAGFGIHTLEYYTEVWQLFQPHNAVALFLAQYGGKVLAAILVIPWGRTACYMYGASSDEERQRMPTYLLQWEAMLWAKEQGCQAYDLWGIPDVDENQVGEDVQAAEESGILSRSMGGLYRFKRGFGGREVRYVGAYDAVYSGLLYRLLTAAWKLKKR